MPKKPKEKSQFTRAFAMLLFVCPALILGGCTKELSGTYKDSTGTTSIQFNGTKAIVAMAEVRGGLNQLEGLERDMENRSGSIGWSVPGAQMTEVAFTRHGNKITLHYESGTAAVALKAELPDKLEVTTTLVGEAGLDQVLTRNADGTLSGMGWKFTKQ